MRRGLALATGALVLGACHSPTRDVGRAPVVIVATDSGFVAPDTLHEGLNHIAFENRGSIIHECMFIRLEEGTEAEDYLAGVRSGADFPQGAIDCSGAGLTSPLQRMELWLSLEPGRYLLGCWLRRHLTRTTPHTVVVHGKPNVPLAPPREDAVLRLVDFRFDLVGRIARGSQTIRVEFAGPSMHEVDCFRLEGGRTVEDLRAWYAGRQEGSPRATAMGGVLDSHDLSRIVWMRRDFTVGKYVLWCSMPMMQGGQESGATAGQTHADAGMVMEFDVRM